MTLFLHKLLSHIRRRATSFITLLYLFLCSLVNLLFSRHIVLIYDLSCTPPNYGEFLYFLSIAKLLSFRSESVEIYLVYDKVHPNYQKLDGREINVVRSFVDNTLHYINNLNDLYPTFHAHLVTDWPSFKRDALTLSCKNSSIFAPLLTLRRLPTYHYNSRLLNLFSILLKDYFTNSLLLRSPSSPSNPSLDLLIPEKFIALNVRHNPHWRTSSNTTKEDLQSILLELSSVYPDLPVIILTDSTAYNYFYKFTQSLPCNVIFSSDLCPTSNFFDDANLVLRSTLYIQYLGGGMSTTAYLSSTPFIVVAPVAHERPFSPTRLFSWHKSNQIFIDSSSISTMVSTLRTLTQFH